MEEFCAVMDHVKALQDLEEGLYTVSREVNQVYNYMDFDPGCWPTLMDELVDTLAKMYDDEDDWISWWVFETECGQYHTDITTKEGIRYVIGTIIRTSPQKKASVTLSAPAKTSIIS